MDALQHSLSCDFADVKFADLVNMDICSKVRYHAVLHVSTDKGDSVGESEFFQLQYKRSFCPRIPASYFREFLLRIDPDGEDEVPIHGLPKQQSNGEYLSQQNVAARDCNHELQPSSPRRVSSRKAPPTERGIFDQLQRIWDRTKRLKEPNLSAARILLQERLDFVEDQITAMHPNMLPAKLTRFFSSSDIMKGRHKQ
jgi:hypothetical protein